MGVFSQQAVQTAVHTLLSGDEALEEMVSGVFDFVPAKTAYPYVVVAETRAQDVSTMTETVERISLSLQVFSRVRGRKEVFAILERMHEVLHGAALAMAGFCSAGLRVETSEVRLSRDGLTYQGQMRVTALVQHEEAGDGNE